MGVAWSSFRRGRKNTSPIQYLLGADYLKHSANSFDAAPGHRSRFLGRSVKTSTPDEVRDGTECPRSCSGIAGLHLETAMPRTDASSAVATPFGSWLGLHRLQYDRLSSRCRL